MVVGVVAGTGVICGGAFTTWKFLQKSITGEVSGRLDILEGQVDTLTVSVDALAVAITEKKYEIDKDLVLMVIQAYEAKQKQLARNNP